MLNPEAPPEWERDSTDAEWFDVFYGGNDELPFRDWEADVSGTMNAFYHKPQRRFISQAMYQACVFEFPNYCMRDSAPSERVMRMVNERDRQHLIDTLFLRSPVGGVGLYPLLRYVVFEAIGPEDDPKTRQFMENVTNNQEECLGLVRDMFRRTLRNILQMPDDTIKGMVVFSAIC